MMNTLPQDLRYGARMLMKNPGFRLIAVITLALGIGAGAVALRVAHTHPLSHAQSEQRVEAGSRSTAPGIVEPAKRDPERPDLNYPPTLTSADVATFFDTLIPLHLRRDDIPGAVVAIVKDGRTLFAKGYGYADVAAKRPVTVDATLFRIASISKLFAWTAVMQLVEQGKLDLDRDVNEYLDFRIPATYPQPITLRHLMTHTAGFEEVMLYNGLPPSQLPPLKEFLIARMPSRIFPPGETPAYSNYGCMLAGYIVQRVSGQSYEDYIAERIFRPLGMLHSTFAQPLPGSLEPLLARGYRSASEPPRNFETVQTYPGGSMSSTAEDMTRFMLAHLQEGSLGDASILKPETARMMQSRPLGPIPEKTGMAFAFFEGMRNGHRSIGHGGGLPSFRSQLFLVPDLHLGFYLAQNGVGGDLPNIAWRSFFDRYFPVAAPVAEAPANAGADPRALIDSYKQSRRFDTSIFKLYTLFNQSMVFRFTDGALGFDGVNEYGRRKPLRQVSSMNYRAVDGPESIEFRKDFKGNLEIVGDFSFHILQRVPWYEKRRLNMIVICASAAVFALTLLFWPVGALTRLRYGRRLKLSRANRLTRVLIRLVCALNLTFILAGYALFWRLPDPSLNLRVHLLQAAGVIGAVGTLIVLYDAVRCWADRERWWFSKVHAVALGLACLSFVGFALIWRLFDFSLRY
jgi:CubicO group peptidase (beta-lactamase class C family)